MQTDAGAAAPNRLRLPLVAAAVLVIGATVALALMLPAGAPPAPPPAPAAAVAAAPAASPLHSFIVAIAGGQVQGGEDTLKVRQGEQVELRVSSDQPVVLHLHGYEVEAQVVPPQPALLAFKADIAGRFPVHEHREGAGNHRAVLFIEVYP